MIHEDANLCCAGYFSQGHGIQPSVEKGEAIRCNARVDVCYVPARLNLRILVFESIWQNISADISCVEQWLAITVIGGCAPLFGVLRRLA